MMARVRIRIAARDLGVTGYADTPTWERPVELVFVLSNRQRDLVDDLLGRKWHPDASTEVTAEVDGVATVRYST